MRRVATWSDDEILRATDLLRDGYPVPSIAKMMNRSRASVAGMMRKLQIPLKRPKTPPTQVQVAEETRHRQGVHRVQGALFS